MQDDIHVSGKQGLVKVNMLVIPVNLPLDTKINLTVLITMLYCMLYNRLYKKIRGILYTGQIVICI